MRDADAPEPTDVRGVLQGLIVHPVDRLARRWNWKAAVLSALSRGALFFAVNLGAGLDAARAALVTEFVLRAAMSGFYGTLTQSFRRVEPKWAGTAAAVVVLPLVSHSMELLAHWARGTAALLPSLAASVLFTVISTAFHLHVMRQNVLTVGRASQSLSADLKAMPRLFLSFLGVRGHRVECRASEPLDAPR